MDLNIAVQSAERGPGLLGHVLLHYYNRAALLHGDSLGVQFLLCTYSSPWCVSRVE